MIEQQHIEAEMQRLFLYQTFADVLRLQISMSAWSAINLLVWDKVVDEIAKFEVGDDWNND